MMRSTPLGFVVGAVFTLALIFTVTSRNAWEAQLHNDVLSAERAVTQLKGEVAVLSGNVADTTTESARAVTPAEQHCVSASAAGDRVEQALGQFRTDVFARMVKR
jgi:hypothetical protein